MSGQPLADRRVLVVGASSGIGRAFAIRALDQGARVVLTARRAERLSAIIEHISGALRNASGARGAASGALEAASGALEAASGKREDESGPRGIAVAVTGDVRRPEDCRRMVEEAASVLGSFDLLLYCAGVAPLRRLAATTEEDWAAVLETHVVGAHHVLQAALSRLSPQSIAAVVSSETVGRPRSGLGAYGASKAALEESMRAWRMEHPERRFLTIAIGATFPTEFGDDFDPDSLTEALEDWTRHGLMTETMLDPDEVAGALAGILGTAIDFPGVGLEHIVLRPPSPVVGTRSPT